MAVLLPKRSKEFLIIDLNWLLGSFALIRGLDQNVFCTRSHVSGVEKEEHLLIPQSHLLLSVPLLQSIARHSYWTTSKLLISFSSYYYYQLKSNKLRKRVDQPSKVLREVSKLSHQMVYSSVIIMELFKGLSSLQTASFSSSYLVRIITNQTVSW